MHLVSDATRRMTPGRRTRGIRNESNMVVKSCQGLSHQPLPYAKARMAALRTAARPNGRVANFSTSSQRLAASYKWDFVNSSANCWHFNWESMLAQQRKFAQMFHVAQSGCPMAAPFCQNRSRQQVPLPRLPECSIWGSLYNQVHVGWNASWLEAIFYVNDTHTQAVCIVRARKAVAGAVRVRQLRARLRQHAMVAASRARTVALLAQRILATQHGVVLPVVQYVFTEECYRADRLLRRLIGKPGPRQSIGASRPSASERAGAAASPSPEEVFCALDHEHDLCSPGCASVFRSLE